MAWIASYQDLRNHPKVKKAARLLNISEPELIGYLHYFWWWAIDHAQDGSLDGYETEDIEAAVDWKGEAGAFMNALLECGRVGDVGFIERTETGIAIHDWMDYAGKLIERRQQDANRKRAKRPQDIRRTSAGYPQDVPCRSDVTVQYSTVLTPTTTTAPASENLPVPNPQTGDFFKRIEQAGILVSPIQAEQYEAIIEQAGGDYKLLNEAIDDAVSKGDRPYPDYLKKIIDRCLREGLRPGQWQHKNRDGPKRNNGNGNGTYTHKIASLPPGFNLEKNE